MAAGARLLDSAGYRDLNVENICTEAELAKGTFYVYFESKEVFLNQLITRYIGFEEQTYPRGDPQASAFRRAMDWVTWYERSFAANVGILRCLVQLSAASIEHLELWHQRNRNIVDRALDQVARQLDIDPDSEVYELMRMSVRSVGGMMDQSLFERHNINVGAGREEIDLDLTIELHAVLIYRAIYGENPPLAEVERVRPLLALPHPAGAVRRQSRQR
ncbi:MAG: TetR/AcrR family transcriptional regulator [Sterolibacterium sp.]|jgi:AcrR family transcriptional regulator